MSLFLVVVLALGCCMPAYAATYTDLKDHWAKEDMEDLVKRGFLSGYSDQTMKPNKNMTAGELLVMLSRFYPLTEVQSEKLRADYEKTVEQYIPAKFSWAKDSIGICLAAGIISETELKLMDLSSEIEKQQLAVLLIRAMQLTDAAEQLKDAQLDYVDANQILSSCRGSVSKLAELEIVKGDAKNQFAPTTKVSRAVIAAMVSRAIKYLEKNDVDLVIRAYEGLEETKGILLSVSSGTVQLRGFNGSVREYAIPSAATVKVNGEVKSLSASYEGCYVRLIVKKGTVTDVLIEKDSNIEWVQGTISSVNASNASLYLINSKSGKSTSFTIPSKAVVTQDGKSISLSSISQKNYVTIKSVKNAVTEVYSQSGDFELSGTITEITYGTSVSLKVKVESGECYAFLLDISNLPTIKRGAVSISIDRLKAGNEVTVVMKNCEISSIVAKGSENKLTGKLTSITTTASGTIWSLSLSDGAVKSLMLEEGVGIYSGNKAILLSDIRIGDEVSVVLYGDVVTEVYLQSAVSSSNKVSGRALTVSKNEITILTFSEKLLYVDTASAIVVTASTGKSMSLSSLEKNSVIVAYGSYENATKFVAKLVVVE